MAITSAEVTAEWLWHGLTWPYNVTREALGVGANPLSSCSVACPLISRAVPAAADSGDAPEEV